MSDVVARPKRVCAYFKGVASASECEQCGFGPAAHHYVPLPPDPAPPTFDDHLAKAGDKEVTELFRSEYVAPPAPDKYPWEIEPEASDGQKSAPPYEFRFVTTDEYLAEPDDAEWSLYGQGVLVKSGAHIYASEYGVGKTSHLRELGIYGSAGVEYHGLSFPRKLRVLLLEAEGNRTYNRQRFRILSAASGVVGEVLHLGPGCEPPQIGKELEKAIEATRAELVFLDTVGYFADFDENLARDWKRHIFRPLRKLGRAFSWEPAFVLTHHFGKPSENRSGVHRVRGSSAIPGDADTVVTFERRKDGKILQTFDKLKNGPPMEPRVHDFDGATGRLTWLPGETAGAAEEGGTEDAAGRLAAARSAVLRYVRKLKDGGAGYPPSGTDIETGVTGDDKVIREAREALAADGELVKVKRQGRGGGYAYELPFPTPVDGFEKR